MSFSGEVKEELSKHNSQSRHCQLAELAAISSFCGQLVRQEDNTIAFMLSTENQVVVRKYFTLLKKTFNIDTTSEEKLCSEIVKNSTYNISLEDADLILKLFRAMKFIDGQGVLHEIRGAVSPLIIKNSCCKRTFLRGAFLANGSMSDPEKSYHLEIVCVDESQAEQLKELMQEFSLDAKIVHRKKYFVVYLKEGSNIVDFLNICEAHVSLMNFENLRIVKEMRNSINRRVNCEAANITKTVNASTKQIADIMELKENYGFENLSDNLRQMAEVRLENPDASLQELGQYLNPPVGKSGVNHRLRKLGEIANLNRN
ncbi:MAG: DNA-binding protein WhiA [Eubacteriales bacterium]